MYVIRDKEAGNIIDSFDTLELAESELTLYEEKDKIDGIYSEGFYEIIQEDA